MTEYIITDMQAKEIADHLPTFYLPTWLYKWAESKTVNVGKAAYQVNDVHVSVNLPEIVRCRDCKYHELVPEDSGDWCEYWTDRVYGADGFCKWSEKRGDAE